MKKQIITLFSAFLLSWVIFSPATAANITQKNHSKNQTTVQKEVVQPEDKEFSVTNEKLKQIKSDINQKNASPKIIDEYVTFLTDKEGEISDNKQALDRQIKFIKKQLDALGHIPLES